MDRIDHVVEIAKSSHHLPMLLPFLLGLFAVGRDRSADIADIRDDEIVGDNVPTTLIEGIGR